MLKCECGFKCDRAHNLQIHRESKNHEKNMEKLTSQLMNHVNNGKFCCRVCDYSTVNKANYRKHIISVKHQNKVALTTTDVVAASVATEAANVITSDAIKPVLLVEVMDMFLKHQTELSEKQLHLSEKQMEIYANSSQNQQIQNTEMFKALTDRILAHQEQQQQIVLLQQQHQQQQQPPTQLQNIMLDQRNTTTTTTNSHNKKFNLNLFLNEDCKNAMNLSDFVKSVVVSMEDLEHLGHAGYVEGMTRILTKAIREKETTERPVHCTDVKREKFIIRENDAWKKDVEHEETQRAVTHIAHKNYKVLMEWRQQHPEHEIADTPDYETWYRISRNMCNTEPGAMKKLVQHMATITAIEKGELVIS